MRTTLLLLFISIFHQGFSQEKKFDRFIEELEIYELNRSFELVNDSVINWGDYKLEWTKTTGTYGGSEYCCGGKIFPGDTKEDIPRNVFSLSTSFDLYPYENLGRSIRTIGDRYIIEEVKYPEPQPTSAFHYIYVLRYYRSIEK